MEHTPATIRDLAAILARLIDAGQGDLPVYIEDGNGSLAQIGNIGGAIATLQSWNPEGTDSTERREAAILISPTDEQAGFLAAE